MAKIKATIKKDSPAADIIKAAKEEKQAFKEAVESGNNKQPELRYKDDTPMRKYNSPKLQAIEMEDKQTAVEWLIDQIKKDSNIRLRGLDLDELEEQAKQMEKQQILNELKLIGSYFDVSKLDVKEISHHIRFTSIIQDRINHYNKIYGK